MSTLTLLLAPDSFKGTLTATQVCEIMASVLQPHFNCVCHPLADGGEGTLTAISTVLGGDWQTVPVQGPLPDQIVNARYLWLPETQTAVIEMAEASGLTLVPPGQRNPEITTSYGTGQLLRHAEGRGANVIQLAIGGSATNDGGLGLLMALGWQFLDSEGRSVGWGGQALAKVRKILPPSRPFKPLVTVWCDVTNPFYGPQGAAFTYAPQKGADPLMVKRLDDGLRHFAHQVQQEFQVDLNFPGAGAAGGMGGGVVWGLNAQLESGFTAIAELTQLEKAIKQCDGVITGEGCFDQQSLQGKVVGSVIELAQTYQKPVFVIAGQTRLKTHPAHRVADLCEIAYLGSIVGEDLTLAQSLANPTQALAQQLEVLRTFLLVYQFD
ncbi:MAG: hypothetical protein RLZZ435_1083 [Cyanobacteriota bacterium]|jgi:glycerate kinase